MCARVRWAALAAGLLAACGPGNHAAPQAFVAAKGPGESCTATAQCQGPLVCAGGTCGALAAAASCAAPPGSPAVHAGDTFDPGDPGPDACISTVRAAALDPGGGVAAQDLDEHGVGEKVTFSVPPGTTSFMIMSQAVNGSAPGSIVWNGVTIPNTAVPDQVRTPSGALFFDDLAGTSPDAFFGAAAPVAGAFTAPNTSAGLDHLRSTGSLAAGDWSFVANDWAQECLSVTGCTGGSRAGRYRLHALTRSGPIASTGTLDVEVYLLVDPAGPSSAISTAAGAAADPQLSRWVRSLSRYLAKAGLCLGDVTFHDVPAWVHRRFPDGSVDVTRDGPCDPLAQLFTTAIAPRRAVHLFLVEELVAPAQGSASIVGVDGSIPGPSGFPGTVSGGAAVGLFGELGAESSPGACAGDGGPSLAACGTDRLAYVAAHEVGHWLGLYHATERTGDAFDPIGDTPQCPCSTCAPASQRAQCSSGGVSMGASTCSVSAACGGGGNLMFWLLDPQRSTGELSRDQGQVMRLDPAVR